MRGEPISRILSKRLPPLDDHSSANRVTTAVKLPTRASRALASLRRYPWPCGFGPAPREAPIWHCSGWGLPCRSCYQSRGGLLPRRFTITTMCRRRTLRVVAVSSLWRFPWGYPRRALPGTLANGSPDFPRRLPPAVIQPSARGRNYAWTALPSTGKRLARSAASERSVSSSGPRAQGRKRRRKAARRIAGGRSG